MCSHTSPGMFYTFFLLINIFLYTNVSLKCIVCIVVLCPFGIPWFHRNIEFLFGVHPVFNFIVFFLNICVCYWYKQINIYSTLKHNYLFCFNVTEILKSHFYHFPIISCAVKLGPFCVFWSFFLNKFYPTRILVTLLGKGLWVDYCKILITHQNREISRNVGSTTVTLLNYMTVTAVLWAGRKLSALEMGADRSPNSIACKSAGGWDWLPSLRGLRIVPLRISDL